MTRPIKFRAWDKDMKRMRTVVQYHPVTRNIFVSEGKEIGTGLIEEEYVLMQFTGLLDSKGKEIYEGDILKWNTEVGEYRWEPRDACFVFFNNENKYPSMYPQMMDEKNMEIIGNIYENPNLIK